MSHPSNYPTLDLHDISQMRATITLEIESNQPWERVNFCSRSAESADPAIAQQSARRNSPWILGPLHVTFKPWKDPASSMTTDNAARQATFNSEYGSLLVGDQWRQHFISDNPHSFCVGEQEVFQFEAFELLHVRPISKNAFRALLTIHARITTANDQLLSQALREHEHISDLLRLTRKVLEDSGAFIPRTVFFPGREPSPAAPDATLPFAPPPFITFWLPPNIVQSSAASADLRTQQDQAASHCALAEVGWRWTQLPGHDGVRFEGEHVDRASAQLHVFSHSWAVSMSEYAVAYLPQEDKGFVHQAIAHAFTTHLDVCLLVLRTRLILRDLSARIAHTAQQLSDSLQRSHDALQLTEGNDGQALQRNLIVDQAIRLDAEAAAFVASTWGADVSPRHHLDVLMRRLQKLGHLDVSIGQLVDQARWLRDSTRTLIEREEHHLDQQRASVERSHQESARAMEVALGFLAFLGLPLGIAAELYSADKWNTHWGTLLLGALGIVLPLVVGAVMTIKMRRLSHPAQQTPDTHK